MVLKINKNKFEIFLEVAKELNSRFNVAPIIFCSLGLYRRIGEFGKSNDVDILVPSSLVNEKWSELIKLMQNLTFKLYNEKEHEFIRKKEIVAFGKQEDLVKNCKINSGFLEISNIKKVKFRQLLPEQYLLVYRFMLRDNYRQEKRGNADKKKIMLIEKYLQKATKAKTFSRS